FDDAADFAARLAAQVIARPFPVDTLLNVNVPAVARARMRGFRITRQGKRRYGEALVEKTDPRGKKYYWIGGDELDFVDEIGTDCGYQTAVLAELVANVFSVERISSLATAARQLLDELGYYNVAIRVGDGTLGWSDEAPFDAIVVTAGTPQVPRPLISQLADGGRLVFPIGEEELQTLVRIRKERERLREEYFGDCRFVKLVGRYG